MTTKISDYIKEQTCASLCCVDEYGQPYCFSCYYAYNSDEQLLYYKSPVTTQHALILSRNPAVAGTILPDKLNRLHVMGLQFEGLLLAADHPSAKAAASLYYRKNPGALVIAGEVCTIQINAVKFTDSSLGFGKKLNWSREDAAVAQ